MSEKPDTKINSVDKIKSETKNPNKKVLIVVASVIGGLVVLSIIGSIVFGMLFKKAGTKIAETAFEKSTGTKIDVDDKGGKVTVKGEDGKSSFSANDKELPENFPNFIKLYPKAKLVTSTSYASDDGEFFSASFQTKDSPKKVFDFFKDELSEKNGYKVISTSQSGDMSMIQTKNESKGRTVSATIMTDNDSGGSTVQINTGALNE